MTVSSCNGRPSFDRLLRATIADNLYHQNAKYGVSIEELGFSITFQIKVQRQKATKASELSGT